MPSIAHLVRSTLFIAAAIGITAFTGLAANEQPDAPPQQPRFVPLPQKPASPAENPTTADKVALGKQLFFDPRLSGDNRTSCATCHRPESAFADGIGRRPGLSGKLLPRNTPTVLNTGLATSLFREGRAATLEDLSLEPITAAEEMNQDLDQLEAELNDIPGYVDRFREVFGRSPDREGVAAALAAFQRTVISGPSPFDRYLAGDEDALPEEARLGFELFRGEAGCADCHHGPLLSDGQFYRLGVTTTDVGRGRITGKAEDRFRFRTPSLRNIAETAPYMHDGSQRTLTDVVTFYYRGIPSKLPDGLEPDVSARLGQSFTEIPLIVAFLQSLSGKSPEVSPPLLPGWLTDQPDTSISPAQADEHGILTHRVESPLQKSVTKIHVLLPESARDLQPGDDTKYPVIFVLPVEGGDSHRYGDPMATLRAVSPELRNRAIFVSPTFAELPWYADHPEVQNRRQEAYFLKVVVPFIERAYPVIAGREGRFLLGFSKSGWGAWSLLLRHPDTFQRAVAWDAPMMMDQPGKYGSGPIFGTAENFRKYQISRLLGARAESLRDRSKRLILHGYGSFRSEHQQVQALMQELRIPHGYEDGPRLRHHWDSGWVPPAVKQLLSGEEQSP